MDFFLSFSQLERGEKRSEIKEKMKGDECEQAEAKTEEPMDWDGEEGQRDKQESVKIHKIKEEMTRRTKRDSDKGTMKLVKSGD